ncbi:glycosyltransferase family 25 protein [Roseomonas sp. 18066]|uniref:glycosyltransferase family 25 protein n=1 Tax=Roseomonas sp. 18066 TaxID=2681412 RepID=UPI00135B1622|nr:glycosyltransferase family 25 protein [Roseomonas sp. 18066]
MDNLIRVISLDRTPERFALFQKLNPDLAIERFAACDGRLLDRRLCVEKGLFASGLPYSAGACGSAVSHIALWNDCISRDMPMHIAEDDAVIRPDFHAVAARLLAAQQGWDIVLWSHNDNWPVGLVSPVAGTVSVLEGAPLSAAILGDAYPVFRAFRGMPALVPLASAAGLGLYSISPRGARKLLQRCLPLAGEPARDARDLTKSWRNTALDVELSRHYAGLDAYLALPIMAVMINDEDMSTILNP